MENARRTSHIFRDRSQSALDTAIFWAEYVIRHGGAQHLQSAAVKLAWYQYHTNAGKCPHLSPCSQKTSANALVFHEGVK